MLAQQMPAEVKEQLQVPPKRRNDWLPKTGCQRREARAMAQQRGCTGLLTPPEESFRSQRCDLADERCDLR